MDHPARATNILEYLTARNPPVNNVKCKDRTNTTVKDGHIPAQLVEWKDFTLQTLRDIWDGDLFRAAHAPRGMPWYPDLDAYDVLIKAEEEDREVIHNWSRYMVRRALQRVGEEFQPSVWIKAIKTREKKTTPHTAEAHQPATRELSDSARNTGQSTLKDNPKTKPRLRGPDGSAVTYQDFLVISTLDEIDEEIMSLLEERQPKEYKPSRKWEATKFVNDTELFYPDGHWRDGADIKDTVKPIRQAFTYCLASGCRYGCIITCTEAFLFRVGLRSQLSDCPDITTDEQFLEHEDRIRKMMTEDGLMEYVIVPWDSCCTPWTTTLSDWTVNLALWFLHVLAGQSFRIHNSSYPPLARHPRPVKPETTVLHWLKRGRDLADDGTLESPRKQRRGNRENTLRENSGDSRDESTVIGVAPSSSAVTARSVSSEAEDGDETARTEVYESSSADSRQGKDDDEDSEHDPLYASFNTGFGGDM